MPSQAVVTKSNALASTFGEAIAEFFGTMVVLLFGDGCVATFSFHGHSIYFKYQIWIECFQDSIIFMAV